MDKIDVCSHCDSCQPKYIFSTTEKHIYMIFKINGTPEKFLTPIINDVFLPILENELEGNKCLIFFLDYKPQLYSFDHKKICKLSTENFTQENIENWINEVEQKVSQEKLPATLSTEAFLAASENPQSIYRETEEGKPFRVYKDIYQIFDITWHNSEVHRRVS